uniref:HAT C-terminal dimerisation domain-containing protein n=1 Tax=Sipha flava TaxID=143950 RepID=A0A2S2R5R2_9HEMI
MHAYPALYLSYKLLITFSISQVGCERSFSKLKYVKNYLRNSITQDHLESFILMNVEKEILTSICPATIIDKVALNSNHIIISSQIKLILSISLDIWNPLFPWPSLLNILARVKFNTSPINSQPKKPLDTT